MRAEAAECLTFASSTFDPILGKDVIVHHNDGIAVENCLDEVVLTAVEYAVLEERAKQMEGIEEITPESIASAFSWGFGTYMLFWFFGYKVRVARGAIRAI